MPALTALQKRVLDHLDRVAELPYKVPRKNPLRRYQLDGKECSMQVTSLIVHGYVRETEEGQLLKLRHFAKPLGSNERRRELIPELSAPWASTSTDCAIDSSDQPHLFLK